ncbi:MAG: hypothetical protein MUO40_01935 [Anaerolineaceae bacterium]|nr:hypothetical protein [Anaerolineaceae bacterium]
MKLNRLTKIVITEKGEPGISHNFDRFGSKCFETIKETLGRFQQKWFIPLLGILTFVCLTGCVPSTESEQSTVQATLPSFILATATETTAITPSLTATNVLTEFPLEPSLSAEDCAKKQLPEIACTGVTMASQWVPVMHEFNGIEMMLVPAGCFQMGHDNTLPEERPAHCLLR